MVLYDLLKSATLQVILQSHFNLQKSILFLKVKVLRAICCWGKGSEAYISLIRQSLISIKIIYAKPLEDLVNQNFILNQSKTSNSHLVERVDRRKYGGGYGLPKEWLELLNHLTIMTLDNSLSAYDILDYLHLMRKVSKPFAPKKDVVPFIDDSKFTYSLNDQFLSSFNKYEIVADLERILDLDLVLSDSDLAKYPKETISSIITFYQSLREKVLRELEIAYKKNYKK